MPATPIFVPTPESACQFACGFFRDSRHTIFGFARLMSKHSHFGIKLAQDLQHTGQVETTTTTPKATPITIIKTSTHDAATKESQ